MLQNSLIQHTLLATNHAVYNSYFVILAVHYDTKYKVHAGYDPSHNIAIYRDTMRFSTVGSQMPIPHPVTIIYASC